MLLKSCRAQGGAGLPGGCPALIVLDPGAILLWGGSEAMERAAATMLSHRGPIYVIDTSRSSAVRGFDDVIGEALMKAGQQGCEGTRLWGSPDGVSPPADWPGRPEDVHGCMSGAAISIAPGMIGRSAVIVAASGAWIEAVTGPLRAMGWDGAIMDAAPITPREEIADEDPDPEMHLA